MQKRKVIVIGAGAAGLVAAGQAAETGAEVILLEKMQQPGRKLSITGKGRCNLTNTAPLPEFIQHFGKNGRFLRQAFSCFFSTELVAFLRQQGVNIATERGGRVFPASNEAQEIVDALVSWNKNAGVILRSQVQVTKLIIEAGKIVGVQLRPNTALKKKTEKFHAADNQTLPADAVILAAGGASYPGTGSTGDGFQLAKSVGHTIVPIRPALTPLETAGDAAKSLQGLSLKNVKVSLWENGKKTADAFGEMLFTHFGLSGPIILSLSKPVVDGLRAGKQITISIDLKPALDHKKLDQRLLRDFNANGKQKFQTLLKTLLPRTAIPVCIKLSGISPDKLGHQITANERKQLRLWLKDFQLKVTGYRPLTEALVTAGGISLKEVIPRTMASRQVEGLYFAGEVLDLDADTGGYNLQAAFSTGWLAGRNAGLPETR